MGGATVGVARRRARWVWFRRTWFAWALRLRRVWLGSGPTEEMAQNLKVCAIDPKLVECLKKFRLRKVKTLCAIIMKIDVSTMTIVEDESFSEDPDEDLQIEDLSAELPAHEPRYIALNYCYKHDDGRVSYPLVFIFISPQGIKPELQMMYAGSKLTLVNECGFTKVFELRSTEEFTEEWLISKLKFFK